MRKDFQFDELQRGVLWAKLSLTAGQVADLAGVSQRQVTYWKRRGFLFAAGSNPERLNGDDVDMCVLIKQALNAGVPLRRAVELARDYLQEELAGTTGLSNFPPEAMTDMRVKLRGAEASIKLVIDFLQNVSPEQESGLEDSLVEEVEAFSVS